MEGVDGRNTDMAEQIALLAPIDLGLHARHHLEAAMQPGQPVVLAVAELGSNPRSGLDQEHLDPLIVAGEAVLGDQPLIDHRPLQVDGVAQPRLHQRNERGDQQRLRALPGAGAAGGTEAASSAKYLRTVRQSQPHSRPISANVAPASCRTRKRRMFIQDSKSRIMSRSPFGSSTCRWTTEG